MTEQQTSALPDDARECCRAALKISIEDELSDARARLASILELIHASSVNDADLSQPSIANALSWMTYEAQQALETIKDYDSRITLLIRHGTDDHRGFDAGLNRTTEAA